MAIVILIPAYRPSKQIVGYVQQLKEQAHCNIVVVDDGNDHSFDQIFEMLSLDCTVLHHEGNKGKGEALKTGFSYILRNDSNCSGVITVDADGQHDILDVVHMIALVKEKPDQVIFGVRDFYGKDVPWKNKFGNRLTSFLCKLKYHRAVSDTQTGLRFYPKRLLSSCLTIYGSRFEYEFAVLIFLFQTKEPILELSIQTIYLLEETPSNFRRIKDSYRIYKLLFQRRRK